MKKIFLGLLAVSSAAYVLNAAPITSSQIVSVVADLISRVDEAEKIITRQSIAINELNATIGALKAIDKNTTYDSGTDTGMRQAAESKKTKTYIVTAKRKLWVFDSPKNNAKVIDRLTQINIERNVTLDINGRCKLLEHTKRGYVKCWHLNFKD